MAKVKKATSVKGKKKSNKKGKSKLAALKQAKPSKPKAEKVNIFVRIKRYFKEIRNEMRKVAWPTRSEVISFTMVVLATVIILAFIVGVLDVIFQYVVTKII